MNYIRKLIGGAIVGATISKVVSMNRDGIYRLLHYQQRRKIIENLEWWYQADLRDYQQYASDETELYIEEKANDIARSLRDEAHSENVIAGYLVELHQRSSRVVYLHLKAPATNAYADRLFALGDKRAQPLYDDAGKDLAEAKRIISTLNEDKFPIDGLLKRAYLKYVKY